jgi:hypothetical protein
VLGKENRRVIPDQTIKDARSGPVASLPSAAFFPNHWIAAGCLEGDMEDSWIRWLMRQRGVEASERDMAIFKAGVLLGRSWEHPDDLDLEAVRVLQCLDIFEAVAKKGGAA